MPSSPIQIQDPKVDAKALVALIEPIMVAHGMGMVELSLRREPHGWLLRVTVENPTSTEPGLGITLDNCAEASRDISHALDAEDLIPFAYTLEVTSPGVERPLRTAEEFERFSGKRAKVVLSKPTADGQKGLVGVIVAVAGDDISLEVDGKVHTFAAADVARAHLVFDFGHKADHKRSPKKGPRKPKQDTPLWQELRSRQIQAWKPTSVPSSRRSPRKRASRRRCSSRASRPRS